MKRLNAAEPLANIVAIGGRRETRDQRKALRGVHRLARLRAGWQWVGALNGWVSEAPDAVVLRRPRLEAGLRPDHVERLGRDPLRIDSSLVAARHGGIKRGGLYAQGNRAHREHVCG